jgi:crotonobetainyl-CoA:carnitine CoA-transferase CaiB-like acyl-CoA transferase
MGRRNESPNFLAWNRNKRSLAIDLTAPEARAILYKIGERADVVVQNFRPGVLDKLGFGYADSARSTRESSTAQDRATATAALTPRVRGKTC